SDYHVHSFPTRRSSDLANKTIMVVESKIEMQNVLRDRLKKYGYRVLIFSDPQRAIKRFVDDDHQPADCVMFCAEHLGRSALESRSEEHTSELQSPDHLV